MLTIGIILAAIGGVAFAVWVFRHFYLIDVEPGVTWKVWGIGIAVGPSSPREWLIDCLFGPFRLRIWV